jgi:thiamine kinase-like enzyme
MTISIDEVVAAIPEWRGRALTVEPIPGGLTNANYRVAVDGVPCVVRIPGSTGDLLDIDRDNERHNTAAAASIGVAARILHEVPEEHVLVLEWIEGRTMSIEAFAADQMPERVAAVLRRLHAGPRFLRDFDMFRLVERYLRVVDERDVTIPEGYRARLPLIARIEEACAVHPLPSVPCHNDLLAENYIDDGRTLWIVDYEYSGNGDPTFELGNTCQELGWDEDRINRLSEAYFGRHSLALLARMRLQMIMSDVGWTLWAAIQSQASSIDYDFWGWAVERWGRASAGLDGGELGSWLAAVRRDP